MSDVKKTKQVAIYTGFMMMPDGTCTQSRSGQDYVDTPNGPLPIPEGHGLAVPADATTPEIYELVGAKIKYTQRAWELLDTLTANTPLWHKFDKYGPARWEAMAKAEEFLRWLDALAVPDAAAAADEDDADDAAADESSPAASQRRKDQPAADDQ